MQVLFLQGHSTCFGRKRPSSGVFKTSTAATGTCVIVAGKSSHHLIRAYKDNTCTSGRCTSFKYSWWWALAPETCRSDSAEIKPAQCCIKLVFHLTYTMMQGNTKLKFLDLKTHGMEVQICGFVTPTLDERGRCASLQGSQLHSEDPC